MAMSRFIIEFGDRLDGHFLEKAFTQNGVQTPYFIAAPVIPARGSLLRPSPQEYAKPP